MVFKELQVRVGGIHQGGPCGTGGQVESDLREGGWLKSPYCPGELATHKVPRQKGQLGRLCEHIVLLIPKLFFHAEGNRGEQQLVSS